MNLDRRSLRIASFLFFIAVILTMYGSWSIGGKELTAGLKHDNKARISEQYGKLPLLFEANAGLLDSGYVYTVSAAKPGLNITPPERKTMLNRPLAVDFFANVGAVSIVSAASFRPQDIVSNGIMAVFGAGFATASTPAPPGQVPYELDGLTVSLEGYNLGDAPSQLFFTSSQQINILTPFPFSYNQPPFGETLVRVRRNGRVIGAGSTFFERRAPSIFTANSTGGGVPAAVALRVKANGSQVYEAVARYDNATQKYVPSPIDLSDPAEQVYLILYATGVNDVLDYAHVQVSIGGETMTTTFAGYISGLYGLQQINVQLDRRLAGRGLNNLLVTLDGKTSNPVQVLIR